MIEDRVEQIKHRMVEILKQINADSNITINRSIELDPIVVRNNSPETAETRISEDPGTRLLEEWRQGSIPEWQQVLKEARDAGDAGREKYALWMLNEVLEFDSDKTDPEGNSREDAN